jgi:exopolysaccharide biosynthesis polyprenyl glycosylphosphotransferase
VASDRGAGPAAAPLAGVAGRSAVAARQAGARRGADRHLPERLTLVALDVVAAATAVRLAYEVYLRTAHPDPVFSPAPTFVVFAPLIWIQMVTMTILFFFARLYHAPRGLSRVDLVARIFRTVSLGVFTTYAVTSFTRPDLNYSRLIPVYDWGASLVTFTGLRLASRAVWGTLRRAGVGRDRVLVVGAGPTGQDLVARIQRRPWLGYEVLGFVDDTPGRARAHGLPVLGRTAELGRVVDDYAADEVLIALPEASRRTLVDLVSQCQREGLSIKVFPDVFQILAGEVQIGDLDGLPLLTMRDVALRGWRLTLKRAVDIAISAVVLVVTSPIILTLAILVKLDSPGPAFFVQERVGLDGRPFPMLKFRSMRADAEAETGAVWAVRDDPRATRLGAIMRRYSLDELPQFINVLLGHMSIVGPRPERPEFVAAFRRQIPRYMERHQERAGITGWAQVNGLRGDTSIEERTKYDLYYIENWSILLDLKIMAKTFIRMLRDPNAY